MARALATIMFVTALTGSLEGQESNRSLLLRIDERNTSTFFCGGNQKERLIFADGLVVGQSLDDDGRLLIERAMAPSASLQRLSAALAAGWVGFLRGSCASDDLTPNASFTTTITWFGRPPRKSTFVVGDGQRPFPACDEATNTLFDAIRAHLNAALLDPFLTAAVIQVAPAPGCEGAVP